MKPGIVKEKLLKLDAEHKIRFIILFGSVAEKRALPLSDMDIAVYYDDTPKKRFKFQLKAAGTLPQKVDLKMFQDLPLTVQKEVIRGDVLYHNDFDFIFSRFMDVIKRYGSFEKYYEEYLSQMRKEVEA